MSKQGLIYEIVCNITSERYIGSTFEPTVARRIALHRRDQKHLCSSKVIIDRGNYRYGLLETIQVNSRDELRMYERKWFDKIECININRPYITIDEQKAYAKAYREANREAINKKQNIVYHLSKN